MSNGCTAARSSRRYAMRSASSSGSLITRAICSYCSAVVSGSCPERSAAITGAPGQICSIGSHLLRPTRIFMRVACSQISASSAVLPIPAGPEITTLELVPCWLAPRNADSALAIGSLRPRNGPDRTAPPQGNGISAGQGDRGRAAAHRPFGRCPIGGRRPRWSARPRLDSQTRNCGEGGRLRCAMIRTGIWRSPGSCRRGIRAAGQLHRNLDGQGSAGEQYLGARGGPARVPLREYWPVPRRGSGHAGRPAVRRTQPECPLRQALRTGTTSSGTDNQLPAASR